jgi:hypothetical protein
MLLAKLRFCKYERKYETNYSSSISVKATNAWSFIFAPPVCVPGVLSRNDYLRLHVTYTFLPQDFRKL